MKKEHPYFQLLHTNTHSLFCTCLPHREVVPFPSDIIRESEIRRLYTVTKSAVLTTRVYCLATSAPIMTTSVKLIKQLLHEDFQYKTKWLKMYYLKTAPIDRSFKYLTDTKKAQERVQQVITNFNAQLHDTEQSQNADVVRLLSPFPEAPIADPEALLRQKETLAAAESQRLRVKFSAQLQSIRRFCYPRLLTTITPVTFVSMVNAVMSGRGCIIVSNSAHQLSVACFALLAMLDPLSWQGLFIPIVPPQLTDFLDSPLPAILGTFPPKQSHTIASCEVVYLEKPPMFKKLQTQQHPIVVPQAESMILSVASIVQSRLGGVASGKTFAEREKKLKHMEEKEVDAFVEDIQQLLNKYCIDRPLSMVKKAVEQHHPKDIESFIKQFLEDNKGDEYLSQFVQNQQFNSWWYDTKMSD